MFYNFFVNLILLKHLTGIEGRREIIKKKKTFLSLDTLVVYIYILNFSNINEHHAAIVFIVV